MTFWVKKKKGDSFTWNLTKEQDFKIYLLIVCLKLSRLIERFHESSLCFYKAAEWV